MPYSFLGRSVDQSHGRLVGPSAKRDETMRRYCEMTVFKGPPGLARIRFGRAGGVVVIYLDLKYVHRAYF